MLTVVMATHNGARTLPTVLDAYTRLEAPEGGWKLVVADNASTDTTPEILRFFCKTLPMTIVMVPELGKNFALNAALEFREGDLVVLTDDDAVPARGWLTALRRAANRHIDFDIFGGAIKPRWEHTPDSWILEWVPHDMTYTLTTAGRVDGPLPPTQVCGPNMAVRTSIFDDGHRFDALIGPKAGGTYTMGSETEFTLRMAQNGHASWFVADAEVEHMIRSFQMERLWVLSRASRYGRCIFRRDHQGMRDSVASIAGMPRWMLRDTFRRLVSLLFAKITQNDRRAFEEAWQLRYNWGYLAESRGARRRRNGA